MSKSYQEFVDRYLNAHDWAQRKDGAPLWILDALTDAEKEKAEDEFIQRLSSWGLLSSWADDWPVEGLGHLKSEKAEPMLRRLLPRSFGAMKAKIATAIWKISQDDNMVDVVIRQSRPFFLSGFTSFYEFRQIDIIYCLAELPHQTAKARLEELTRDNRYLISYNAKQALGLRKTYFKIEDS